MCLDWGYIMCGIVAFLSSNKVNTSNLLESLSRLEYRGYDSCGIAYINDDNSIYIRKSVGYVQDLKNDIANNGGRDALSHIGIGHTRWATNGPVTIGNAHPHTSGNICLVHNGIIENYEEIKNNLVEAGMCFYGNTDTEVIAKLIDHNKKIGMSFFNAFKACISKLQGSYSLVVIDSDTPNQMLCYKNVAPLVIGISDDSRSIYAASDILAFPQGIKRCIYAEDQDIIQVVSDGNTVSANFFDRNMKNIERNISQDIESAGEIHKDGFEDYMLKEIHEESGIVKHVYDKIKHKSLAHHRKICFVACGTSYYAAVLSSYYLEKYASVQARCEIASEFRYRSPIMERDCLYVFISQSGETLDTLYALKMVKAHGYNTFALVNNSHSAIAREADSYSNVMAGPEICVASTKAFVAQFASLMALFMPEKLDTNNISKNMDAVLQNNNDIKTLADKIISYKNIVFIGKCYHYAIAMEGALKMKELSYINAQAYCSGEMKHGPIATVDKDLCAIIFAPKDEFFDKTITTAEEITARKGNVVIITNKSNKEIIEQYSNIKSQSSHISYISDGDEMSYPFYEAIYVHLLAYNVAKKMGKNVDKPRNLAKSVTVE